MKLLKKSLSILLIMFMIVGLFSSIFADAKELTIATPKVSIKLLYKKTGVKITIGKTKDADGYEVSISGTPASSEYCEYFKCYDFLGDVYHDTKFTTYIEKNGKAKRSLTYKCLQPGTYTVKVRSWNDKKYGTRTYSEWSKEKSFTLKESATNGYATSYDFSNVKEGDIVKFGAYEQDLNYTNGKEAIEWIVVEKTKKSVLLLSKYAIEKLPYNKEKENVTWETCSLRKWLNNDFIKSAFNKTEQGMIKSTTIENFDNAIYKTSAGEDTKDKIFLLSQLDMINSDFGFSEDYYDSDVNRRCALTWEKNKEISKYGTKENEKTCCWWLRTTGEYADYACSVLFDGKINGAGFFVNNVNGSKSAIVNSEYVDFGIAGVRPALYIKITS